MSNDAAPVRPPTALELKNALVSHEPLSRGNAPYEVWGKHYVPHTKRQPFEQVGTASWYGKKFHGHLTSNGETYDMYAMSAAHKTLPLPSYVKVTNLINNKSVVVRVNDRGPFHQDRIIDLSYSAAYKIGVYETGTAKVKVEVILPEDKVQKEQNYQVIVTGFKSKKEAQETQKGLALLLDQSIQIVKHNANTALSFGPFENKEQATDVKAKVQQFGFDNAMIKITQ